MSMQASGLRHGSTNSLVTSRSRLSRIVIPAVGVMLTAIGVGACGSSSATHAPTAAATQKPKEFVLQSGSGDRLLTAVKLPKAWTVDWNFRCQNPTSSRPFSLTTTDHDGSPDNVTTQTGLAGGGHKPFTTAGSYRFAVTTTCGWKVTVGSTPTNPQTETTVPTRSKAATTTTASSTKTSKP
jgi:hypothetical protein